MSPVSFDSPQEDAGGAAAATRLDDRHQRSEARREAHLNRIKAKAGDEGRKVEEVTFINALNVIEKKAVLQQRLEEGEGAQTLPRPAAAALLTAGSRSSWVGVFRHV